MRKIYILEENEEDGRVLDALLAGGIDPEEIENPQCPRCGSETLLAHHTEGFEYHVLIDASLSDVDRQVRPDAWYLICQDFTCPYEEQVERSMAPEDVEVFDLDRSSMEFDEYSGILFGNPSAMKELMAYLEALRKERPYRKLDTFLRQARLQYEYTLERVRAWIRRIPSGRRISFYLDGEHHEARFVTASEDRLLVQTLPQGEMVAVSAEAIDFYGPQRFDDDTPTASARDVDPDSWVSCDGGGEYVVARGFHLDLYHVDRFGLYHVSTSDPQAQAPLGLEERGSGFWIGRLRRSEIEARFETQRMAKVMGYWVEVSGETGVSHSPYVYTEDPEAAAALGLTLDKPIWPEEELPEYRCLVKRWSGVIPRDQVEEWDEVTRYLWPIPEAKATSGGEDEESN